MEENKPTTSHPRTKPLKVTFICRSDNLGGAAIVTRRLMQALRAEGVDARMVVFSKISDDPMVMAVGSRFTRGWKFMTERGQIAFANGFSRRNLFKVSTASDGYDLSHNPWVRDADIIVPTWINQGLLSLKGIRKLAGLGKPIVWVMHDMWNMTGICHHAMECMAYLHECGNCQFLKGNNPHDLSNRVWHKKDKLYNDVPITFVAVSNWLAECAAKSRLMEDCDVRVIPNAFPVDSFYTTPVRDMHLLPTDRTVILMGAARLDDPIKGFPMAIDALNYLFDNYPEVARKTVAVFFGEIRDTSDYERLRFPHIHLGRINDGNLLRALYARSSVVLSTSLYETLPGTLIEGQAAGCLPVSFGRGGQGDIIEHKVNGYIAKYQDYVDVANGIRWALETKISPESLHEHVRRQFSAKNVVKQYLDLFDELLAKQEKKEL